MLADSPDSPPPADFCIQDGVLLDWDDLDYQLAAAAEELAKAHARAEQLNEEKLVLERRWAHMQAKVKADVWQPQRFAMAQVPISSTAQACEEGHTDSGVERQWAPAAAQKPAPPPSLADTSPNVLKHMLRDSNDTGSGTEVHSIMHDAVSKRKSSMTMATMTSPSSGQGHSQKSLLSALPTPQDVQPSQQARCVMDSTSSTMRL